MTHAFHCSRRRWHQKRPLGGASTLSHTCQMAFSAASCAGCSPGVASQFWKLGNLVASLRRMGINATFLAATSRVAKMSSSFRLLAPSPRILQRWFLQRCKPCAKNLSLGCRCAQLHTQVCAVLAYCCKPHYQTGMDRVSLSVIPVFLTSAKNCGIVSCCLSDQSRVNIWSTILS